MVARKYGSAQNRSACNSPASPFSLVLFELSFGCAALVPPLLDTFKKIKEGEEGEVEHSCGTGLEIQVKILPFDPLALLLLLLLLAEPSASSSSSSSSPLPSSAAAAAAAASVLTNPETDIIDVTEGGGGVWDK